MFEREFEGVPPEVRRKLESLIERAVREGSQAMKELPMSEVLPTIAISCIAKLDSVMLLCSAFRRGTKSDETKG